jgi:hypothetical protein
MTVAAITAVALDRALRDHGTATATALPDSPVRSSGSWPVTVPMPGSFLPARTCAMRPPRARAGPVGQACRPVCRPGACGRQWQPGYPGGLLQVIHLQERPAALFHPRVLLPALAGRRAKPLDLDDPPTASIWRQPADGPSPPHDASPGRADRRQPGSDAGPPEEPGGQRRPGQQLDRVAAPPIWAASAPTRGGPADASAFSLPARRRRPRRAERPAQTLTSRSDSGSFNKRNPQEVQQLLQPLMADLIPAESSQPPRRAYCESPSWAATARSTGRPTRGNVRWPAGRRAPVPGGPGRGGRRSGSGGGP